VESRAWIDEGSNNPWFPENEGPREGELEDVELDVDDSG
jgi:hypothetical protein